MHGLAQAARFGSFQQILSGTVKRDHSKLGVEGDNRRTDVAQYVLILVHLIIG
jgi:hypothetical protein